MEQILLKNIDKPDAYKLANYIENGGYKAIQAALKMEPEHAAARCQSPASTGVCTALAVAMRATRRPMRIE